MSFRLSLQCQSTPDASPRTPRLQEGSLHQTIHLEWTTLVEPTTSTHEPHHKQPTPSLALDEGCYPSFPYRPSYLSYPSCLSFYPSSYPSSSQQELRNKTRKRMHLQSSSEISEISDTSDTLMSETSETLISEISETVTSDSSSEECWAFFPLAILLERC